MITPQSLVYGPLLFAAIRDQSDSLKEIAPLAFNDNEEDSAPVLVSSPFQLPIQPYIVFLMMGGILLLLLTWRSCACDYNHVFRLA